MRDKWISLILVSCTMCLCSSRVFEKKVTVDPEVHMNTTQLITSKGYPCQNYDVHTTDGYILNVQRIPYGKKQTKSDRPVVMLQHGLLSCSACWVEGLVNNSLGFILADAGYDVWLTNSRGNTYAKRHEKLNPKKKEFWEFSWDEMVKYDLPATVDKILKETGAKQIYYVGHSQGGLIGLATMSSNQDFASKIKLFVPLAPAVFLGHEKGPLKLLSPLSKDFDIIYSLLGDGELLPTDAVWRWLSADVCPKEIPSYLCKNFYFLLSGFNEKNLNRTRVPVYVAQNPAGTSVQNLNHFAQMVLTDKFQMYDFGEKENMKKYNQSTPPQYDPSKMTVPTAMFSGTHDWLVDPIDITHLVNVTSDIVFHKIIDGWEHLDFIWGLDAPEKCYTDLQKWLEKYK